jgi:hypothetical protein
MLYGTTTGNHAHTPTAHAVTTGNTPAELLFSAHNHLQRALRELGLADADYSKAAAHAESALAALAALHLSGRA